MMMENKRILSFTVTGQHIEKFSGFSGLVRGTKGYLQATFECSEEWKGCKKAAVFCADGEEYPVPIVDGKCDVPDEVAEKSNWKVKIIGKSETFKILTDEAEVTQK